MLEYGSKIRVNGIAPAAIDTPMLREGFDNDGSKISNLRNFHPSKTIGSLSTGGGI